MTTFETKMPDGTVPHTHVCQPAIPFTRGRIRPDLRIAGKDAALERPQVLAIARGWFGTPFHGSAACVKGVGVDCAQLLIAIYKEAGLVRPEYFSPPYTDQVGLHQKAEIYLEELRGLAWEFDGPPEPADIVVVKHRQIYWHAGIVFEWPHRVLCAMPAEGVTYLDCERDPNVRRYARTHPPKFFTFFPSVRPAQAGRPGANR